MSCANPIETMLLTDYWLGALPAADEERIEEHLLSCDECGERLREVIAFSNGIRQVAQQGNLMMILSDVFLKQIAGQGLRVREYAPPRGGSVQCTVSEDDDFLVGRLAADLTAMRRLDLSICNGEGAEQFRLADIPFSPAAGSIIFEQPIQYAKGAPSETMIARLLTFDDAGAESLVGDYTFIHTRTIPGPAAW